MKGNDEIQIEVQNELENNGHIKLKPSYDQLEIRNRDLESTVTKVTRQIAMSKDATAFALNTLNEAEQNLARIQTPITWKDISAKSMLTASLGIAAWFHGRDVFAEGIHFVAPKWAESDHAKSLKDSWTPPAVKRTAKWFKAQHRLTPLFQFGILGAAFLHLTSEMSENIIDIKYKSKYKVDQHLEDINESLKQKWPGKPSL